jgi:RNA12 protein
MTKKDAKLKEQKERMRKVQRGEWHDGRLDCVAGNGLMSELGIGDEAFGENDWDAYLGAEYEKSEENDGKNRHRNDQDAEIVNGLPVVIIQNYVDKSGNKDEVLNVLAHWAASIVQNQVCPENLFL